MRGWEAGAVGKWSISVPWTARGARALGATAQLFVCGVASPPGSLEVVVGSCRHLVGRAGELWTPVDDSGSGVKKLAYELHIE